MNIVGMGDTAVKEAAQRLEAALSCGSFEFPRMKVVVNLAPSGVKKSGSHFDLAMEVSLLHEAGQMLAINEDLLGKSLPLVNFSKGVFSKGV